MIHPITLGNLALSSNIFCAPLAGCSDFPFRRMTKRFQPGLIFCEMVKMEALIRNDPNTFRLLDYAADMHPIGGQICGSNPHIAAQSAKIIEDLGFDLVDLNCGCPVDKVTKDGSGSGLLKTPERIGEILCNMRSAVNIPITLKIRAGWDEDSINVEEIVAVAEEAGASAICIHGRTRQQGYKGAANRGYIRRGKKSAKKIPVIGNGDIFDVASAESMFQETDCDAILIARGTMGQPWLIEDIIRHFSEMPIEERGGQDLRALFLEHYREVVAYASGRKALLDMRRISCWYLKMLKNCAEMRHAMSRASSLEQISKEIDNFSWERVTGALQVEEV